MAYISLSVLPLVCQPVPPCLAPSSLFEPALCLLPGSTSLAQVTPAHPLYAAHAHLAHTTHNEHLVSRISGGWWWLAAAIIKSLALSLLKLWIYAWQLLGMYRYIMANASNANILYGTLTAVGGQCRRVRVHMSKPPPVLAKCWRLVTTLPPGWGFHSRPGCLRHTACCVLHSPAPSICPPCLALSWP